MRARSRASSTRLLPDTNVLVYETVEDSPHHGEAAGLLDSAGEVVIPRLVVYEYVWVMVRHLGVDPAFVKAKLGEYSSDPRFRLVCEPVEAVKRALALLKSLGAGPRDFNDLVILSVAESLGATLATYDAELRRYAARLRVPVAP